MKNRKRILFIIMALLLAFCMSGCSDDGRVQYLDETLWYEICGITEESTEESTEENTEESTEESTEEGTEENTEESTEEGTGESTGTELDARDQALRELLVGSWQSETMNVEEDVMDGLKAAGQYERYLNIDKTKLTVHANFAFFQDGRATMEIDPVSYQTLMNYLTEEVTGAVLRYYQDALENLGLRVSLEQYLKLLGIRPEEYVARIMQNSMSDFSLNDFRRECRCEVEQGRLYVASDEVELEKRKNYLVIELGETELSFLEYYEDGKKAKQPLGLDVELPISFTRMD